jgi:hypothetical protein
MNPQSTNPSAADKATDSLLESCRHSLECLSLEFLEIFPTCSAAESTLNGCRSFVEVLCSLDSKNSSCLPTATQTTDDLSLLSNHLQISLGSSSSATKTSPCFLYFCGSCASEGPMVAIADMRSRKRSDDLTSIILSDTSAPEPRPVSCERHNGSEWRALSDSSPDLEPCSLRAVSVPHNTHNHALLSPLTCLPFNRSPSIS